MPYMLFDLNSPNLIKLGVRTYSRIRHKLEQFIKPLIGKFEKTLNSKKVMSRVPSLLPSQRYFGLMFLKDYTKLSDEKLLERFNTDWTMQLCGRTVVLWSLT
jgi:transposase, IS5 family